MPVLTVRNTQPSLVVFQDDETKAEYKWASAGDPAGGDVLEVPDRVAENVFFRRAINRGTLVTLDLDEAEAVKDRQSQAYNTNRAEVAQAATASLSPNEERALIVLSDDGTAPELWTPKTEADAL